MAEISAAHGPAVPEMSTSEFLALLKQRRIQIKAQDGGLKISAPAGAVDAALQTELKHRKPALLEALTRSEPGPKLKPLSGVELKGRIPLTPAQQGMWLIDHFNPGDVAYNICEAFRLEQSVDIAVLRAAVDRLVMRHRILRSSFHEEEGELFQCIAESVAVPVEFTDLSDVSAEASDQRCRGVLRVEGRRPFDLKRAPLVRFHLFRLAEQSHVVSFNIHHILADRISLYVMREELVALAEAIYRTGDTQCGDAEAGLPALPVQYAEYAVWMDGWMRSEAIERQIGYWKQKLAGLPAFLEMRHSLPWPRKRSAWGATKPVAIADADAAALKRVGAEEGASPFMTFLAAYAVLLARASRAPLYDGGVDFCVGSPITHRRQAQTERMIGLFVNMLAFRCTVTPGITFRELLRQVRGTALEAYENSDVPFQRLVKALKPDRRSQRAPIFQVMFGYETYMAPVAREMQMEIDPGTARYDLSLHLAESASDALYGVIEYCTDLFTEADAVKLADEFEAIVSELGRDLEQDIWKLPLPEIDHAGESPPEATMEDTPQADASVFKRVSRWFSRS